LRRAEYLLASAVLRAAARAFALLPMRSRAVLATARTATLEGNLAFVDRALAGAAPKLPRVRLLEPYSYGLGGRLAYFFRLLRGMYFLQTSRLFVVDNAYLPIHVAPHRPETTVVQVWHAAAALKRFGLDAPATVGRTERRFIHRNYDYVVVGGEAARAPYASALRTPFERVLPLGAPRTDFFFDRPALDAARARVVARHPELHDRRVVLYAPTFRGRGAAKRAAPGMDAGRLRELLPAEYALVLKTHPNLDPAATGTEGYDVVVEPAAEINEYLAATDVLVTDYSSSIFEWALLRRPLVVLVPDLDEYELVPGLYLDYRSEMIGTQVTDTEGVARAILGDNFDLTGYEEFVARHIGACDGRASTRFVERFGRAAMAASTAGAAAAAAADAPLRVPADGLRTHVGRE
jgi:teichoic acid ribitol-phosphate primase